MTISWPAVLVPSNQTPPELRNAGRGGGAGYTGVEQVVYSDAGSWEFNYRIPIRTRSQRLAWRALSAGLRQGEPVLAKVFDRDRAIGFNSAAPVATVNSSAAERATTLAVSASNLRIEAGVLFSIGHRLHMVTAVLAYAQATAIPDWLVTNGTWSDMGSWVEDGSQPAAYTLKITPPLREAVAPGTAADFVNLACLCVPAKDGIDDAGLDQGRIGTPTIKLVEY